MPHETILAIDDTPDKLELLALMLRQTGYQVSTAGDAREGLTMARLQPPDLIISDVSMPGMDGIELCRRVRADEKLHTVPIMLVTALRQDTESVLVGLQAGADDYLEAPFDPMRLVAKVARLIERKRMEDALRTREKYYRTLIENASDLISIINADGSMRYQSPSLGRLLGYGPEDLLDKSVFDFIHPEDKAESHRAFNHSLLNPASLVKGELRFRHKDGSWHYFVSSLTNLLDDPTIRGIVSNAFNITERKLAEAALKESEAELKEAQRLAGLGSWNLEIKSGVVRWSKETFKIFGLDPALGAPLYSELVRVLTPESLMEMETSLRKTIEQNVPFEAELEAIRPDQSRRWTLSRGEAVRDETGTISAVRGTVLDITERKRAEAELLQLGAIVETSGDSIISLDLDNRITSWNKGAERIFGYTSEEAVGRPVTMLIPEGHQDEERSIIARLREGEPVEHYETVRMRRDGTLIDVSLTASPIKQANGTIIGISKIARDITRRKLAEKALRESEQELADFFEHAVVGLHWVGPDGTIMRANRAELEMLGYTPEEYLGHHIAEFHADPEAISDILRRLQVGEVLHDYKAHLRCKDGSIKPVLIDSSVRWKGGEFVHTRCFTRDISSRQEAEGARDRLAAILEATTDLVSISDPTGQLLYLNRAGRQSLGVQIDEDITKTSISDFIQTPASNPILTEGLPTAASLGTWSGEVLLLSRNGLEIPVSQVILAHKTPGGEIESYSTVMRDITERKQAQKDLLVRETAKRRLAERQTAILNALPANICLIGSDGIILDVNIKWREFALRNNYTESNSGIGDNYLEVCDRATGVWAEGAKEAADGIRAVISGKSKRFELDYPCHSPDEQRWFKLMIAPIQEDPSEGVVIMHVNITEGVLAKMALSDMTLELEAAVLAYRQVLGKSLDVICTVDKEGRFVQVSAAAKDVWGYEPEELIGRRYMDLVHPDDRVKTTLMAAGIMAGVSTSDFDNRYMRKDGSVVDIMWSANWSEADGAMFCVARDVSQIKQAERALEQSAEQLRQAQKLESVGRLAGGIAHDFNNMLTTIQGYSELTLRRLETNDPVRRNIEEIKKAGERSAALTRQLLAFSRQQVLQPVVLDLNKVIADTVTMLHRLIGEDVQLVTSFNPKAGRVKVDPGQLTQIIMNLAVNARDAMPQGGKLTIETANVTLGPDYASQHIDVLTGDYVLLAISDNGMGMSAETQEHIFDPFFTTKEVGKGTGLGLATVYGIVKQSGGDIWVYSEEGVGTTFKVYLPQVAEPTEEAKAEDSSYDMSRGTETILMVEDEEMVRTLTCQILENCGYIVIEAHNGAEALRVCEKGDCQIDLLMTDVVMPQMGGRELAERVAKIYPRMQILYTSGYTDDAVVRHGVIEAGTNFIQKPFTPHGLALKVREVLDSTRNA